MALAMAGQGVAAETLETAPRAGLCGQPDAQCAARGQRANDENVPRALAGYRPQVSASASIGLSNVDGQLAARGGRGAAALRRP